MRQRQAHAGRRSVALPRLVLYWIVVAGLAAVALLSSAVPAAAHAVLVETSPADGAAVAPAPEHVTLRFNEPVALISLRLLDGAGHELAPAAPPVARDTAIELPLARTLPNGWYLVSYRVTSQDSHPVAGSIAFRIGLDSVATPRPASTTANDAPDGTTHTLNWLLRALLYGGLLLSTGLAMQRALGGVPQTVMRPTLPVMIGAAIVAIAAAILGIGVGGIEIAGAGIGEILMASVWRLGADSALGASTGVLALGLIGVITSARSPDTPTARLIGVGGAMLGLASLTLTGHAATASPPWLMAPIVLVHAVMAAFWLGALWPLWLILSRGPMNLAVATLRAFSRRATAATAWLIGAAVILVIVQLARPDAFIGTAYGVLLLAKIGGAAVLLGLAALNRWRLVPRLARGEGIAARALKFTIATEFAFFVAVIALTAGLGSTPPPRAIPPPPPTLTLNGTSDGVNAMLSLSPARVGANQLELVLRTPDGAPLDAQDIEVLWSLPVAGIEPFRRTPTRIAPGTYAIETVTMLAPGRWQIGLVVWRDEFNRTLLRLDAPVGP